MPLYYKCHRTKFLYLSFVSPKVSVKSRKAWEPVWSKLRFVLFSDIGLFVSFLQAFSIHFGNRDIQAIMRRHLWRNSYPLLKRLPWLELSCFLWVAGARHWPDYLFTLKYSSVQLSNWEIEKQEKLQCLSFWSDSSTVSSSQCEACTNRKKLQLVTISSPKYPKRFYCVHIAYFRTNWWISNANFVKLDIRN